MRSRPRLVPPSLVFALVAAITPLAACGNDSAADAGAVDAARTDAGTPDSGRFETPCGASTCTEAELCRIDPTGPCVAVDAGTCGAGEEPCQQGGVSGCTPTRTYSCVALPGACADRPSCVCLLTVDVCGAGASCILPQGQGATIECPFP